jgi:predicted aminopeptidase
MKPLVLALALLLGGCSTVGFYWQATQGHLNLMQAAQPIAQWLDDPAAPQPLKDRLQLAERIRSFASQHLHLPDNASYRRYADLGRPAAVWTVVAAPAWSLQPQSWCFLVAGCVNYRGYFKPEAAAREAQHLAASGLETAVLAVPAYSTLGLLNWAGGDPLLNTFLTHGEGDLARLIFHELAHQVVYVAGDTAFNESFATTVERLGVAQWLAQASEASRQAYELSEQRRRQWRALTLDLKRQLRAVYAAAAQHPEQARDARAKQDALDEFTRRYQQLRQTWGGYSGYDRWASQINNAFLAAWADYEDLVPAFEALFHQAGSWPAFYAQVRALSQLPKAERLQRLRQSGAELESHSKTEDTAAK